MEKQLSSRITKLRENLMKKGFSNRSSEWFIKSDLPDVAQMYPNEPVIIRRAHAIDEMLKAMCDPQNFGYTQCFKIEEGDLFAGIIPMGSNGLGKVFPNYLTVNELRVGSVTNKNQMALLGHNTINYTKVLNEGLEAVIRKAESKLTLKNLDIGDAYNPSDFYRAVIISCKAVIAYSKRFSKLASQLAESCRDTKRKEELKRLAHVCQVVPEKPASNFYEAIHSIWIIHCCLHATMDYMSLGRLDQVLQPFYAKCDKEEKNLAAELLQNFIIKAAGRLNLTTQYLVEQDHMDYNAALGIHPYYLDQRAGLNNFLQNIIIGGKTPDNKDATNECTYAILDAFKKVNLSTPGLYVRLHKDSPEELYTAVSKSIEETKNLPYVLNDEVMIPAMHKALLSGEPNEDNSSLYQALANDYCVDGCWEPVLNGNSEWTFGMINGLTILECTLNRGAALSASPELLRGTKLSIDTGEINSTQDLMSALEKQIQFFVDQSALAMCVYYATTEFVVPTPLVSALFDGCLEEGRDKSWGGAKYNLGGTILGGMPDMVNTIAAIDKWVFKKGKYSFNDILAAMRYNFKAGDSGDIATQNRFDSIKVDMFTNSPQFGNDPNTNELTAKILDIYVNAIEHTKQLARRVFMDPKGNSDKNIIALRAIAGYYGPAIQTFLPNFDLKFTAGLGTFEQYNWQGAGNAASASRNSGDPLAPNFTPTTGTWKSNPSVLLNSFKDFHLERFAAGVITDMCLDPQLPVENVVKKFIKDGGGMLTITIASAQYQEIYELAKAANAIENKEVASEKFMKYADIMVRVGGWNAPFVTLPLSHMENYINRPISE